MKRLLPDHYRLSKQQINTLLLRVQDGDLRVVVENHEVPYLEAGPRFEDWDVYQAAAPLSATDPRSASASARQGTEMLLACMLLHLAGSPPAWARDLAHRLPLMDLIRHLEATD